MEKKKILPILLNQVLPNGEYLDLSSNILQLEFLTTIL